MTPADIKSNLLRAIAEALSTKEDYSPKSSKRSRKRKLPLERVFLLLLTMTGGSLKRELYNNGNGGTAVSASAFCQRRAQLSARQSSKRPSTTLTPSVPTARLIRATAFLLWTVRASTWRGMKNLRPSYRTGTVAIPHSR